MMDKLLNTVTGRNAALDIQFLADFARRTADPDPEDRQPARELVRVAYEGKDYDGPGVHIQDHRQRSMLSDTWSAMPLHRRRTEHVAEAMHGALMGFFRHKSPLAASVAYIPFVSHDLDMTESHLRMSADLAAGNLKQLLPVLQQDDLTGIEVCFESRQGKTSFQEILVDQHPEKLRDPAPVIDGIRHLFRDADAKWSTRTWDTAGLELGDLLQKLCLDLLTVEHPEWPQADRQARVHLEGDRFWMAFEPEIGSEPVPEPPAGLPQP